MKIFLRLIVCGVYYLGFSWFMTNIGFEGFETPIWTGFWIFIGLKVLFITLQDVSGWYILIRFVLTFGLIAIFAPDVLGILLFCAIFFPAAFAWSNLTLASRLATGHGPLEVRRALGRAVEGRQNKPWTY